MPTTRPLFSGSRGARTYRATRKRPWETPGAAFPGIHRCPPVLPGCANIRGRSSPRSAPSPFAGRAAYAFPDKHPVRPVVCCSRPFFLLWRKLLANLLALPMAGVATRNVPDRANFVLLFYRVAEFDLIVVRMSVEHNVVFMQRIVRRRLIPHVEHLLARPQVLFRSAMAVQAELHLQRFLLIHQWHLVHWAVTGVAAHTLIDVNAVIEVHKIR